VKGQEELVTAHSNNTHSRPSLKDIDNLAHFDIQNSTRKRCMAKGQGAKVKGQGAKVSAKVSVALAMVHWSNTHLWTTNEGIHTFH